MYEIFQMHFCAECEVDVKIYFSPRTAIQLFWHTVEKIFPPTPAPPPLNHLAFVSETILISRRIFLDILISSVTLFQKSACGSNPTDCLLL